MRIGILLVSLIMISSVPTQMSHTHAVDEIWTSVHWSVDIGEEIPCRLTTGYGYGDSTSISLRNQFIKMRLDSAPNLTLWLGSGHDLDWTQWDEIPIPEVTFIDTNDIETPFQSIMLGMHVHPYGHTWFNPIIPEGPTDAFRGLLSTWLDGPWGYTINVTPLQIDEYWEYTYWGYEYGFLDTHMFPGTIFNVTADYWLLAGVPSYQFAYSNLLRNCTIVGHNNETAQLTHFFQLLCDPVPPRSVQNNEGQNYTEGTTGNEISWSFQNDPMGYRYAILMNGTEIESGDWTPDLSYIIQDVDELTAAVYNFTLHREDLVGHTDSSTIILTILPNSEMSIDIQGALLIGGVVIILLFVITNRKRK
ncbi:MAG: hypothetical protein ACFFD6_11445 [Candidatus Thorarchaeota archaeon]